MATTLINTGNVILRDAIFRDELLTFAGAGTVIAGTILARDSVSKKLVPYVKGGVANGNGIPKAVLTYDVTAAGAGDESVRGMVSGVVRAPLLIIDADGTNANIDAIVLDELRAFSIVPEEVSELNIYDNQ